MSAFAKLYAARALDGQGTGSDEKMVPKVEVSHQLSHSAAISRRIEAARVFDATRTTFSEADEHKKADFVNNYGAALGMLENVNAGFADVYNRLQEAERSNVRLASECEKQDQSIQQLQYDLEMSKRNCEDSEREAADIAERLITETSRSATLEQKNNQAEQALHDARCRIVELEEICKTLHDGIYTIFGVGSPTHKALDELGRKPA